MAFKVVLGSKRWINEEGMKDSRVVLLCWIKGDVITSDDMEAREFSTHIQCIDMKDDFGDEYSYCYRHYFQMDITRAIKDFISREI